MGGRRRRACRVLKGVNLGRRCWRCRNVSVGWGPDSGREDGNCFLNVLAGVNVYEYLWS